MSMRTILRRREECGSYYNPTTTTYTVRIRGTDIKFCVFEKKYNGNNEFSSPSAPVGGAARVSELAARAHTEQSPPSEA